MIATLALEVKPQLEQRASPELIAYAGLLVLPAVEFEQAVERELALNPALERDERPVCGFCGEYLTGLRCVVCAGTRHAAPATTAEPVLAAQPSPLDVLLAELRPLAEAADVPVLEHLLGSLDERGFLDEAPSRIAKRLGVAASQVDRAVQLLRRHGPPGIAAGDLRECLLLQLDRLPEEPAVALARAIVDGHLERLAAGRWNAIAAALGVARAEVAVAAELVRTRLRPSAPLDDHAAAPPPALPDVIIRRREDTGELAVDLVEPRRLRVAVAPAYEEVDVRRLDPDSRAHVEDRLAEARAFLHRLDRRWQTMRAVAEHVVERQRAFVMQGPRFITPLTRAAVAAELGIHESTVSRATNGRYVLLPSGRLVPFSRFFEPAQGACAALAELVADEGAPRSDATLAAELAELGFRVARRTVAKYREQLGIPPHTHRRREAAFAGGARTRIPLRLPHA